MTREPDATQRVLAIEYEFFQPRGYSTVLSGPSGCHHQHSCTLQQFALEATSNLSRIFLPYQKQSKCCVGLSSAFPVILKGEV